MFLPHYSGCTRGGQILYENDKHYCTSANRDIIGILAQMEHESNNSGSFVELPQPQDVGGSMAETQAAAQPEMPVNQAPVSQPPAPSVSNPQNPPMPPIDPAMQQQTTGASDDQTTMIADDADLIEKEWVTKAKAIVAQTKDDPHTQNREMNKVKADYLKKRYNKDLKISEG